MNFILLDSFLFREHSQQFLLKTIAFEWSNCVEVNFNGIKWQL